MTLAELLSELDLSEDEFVDAVRRGLRARPKATAGVLSEHDVDFLHRHSGLSMTDEAPGTADVVNETRNAAELAAGSLTVDDVAAMLQIDQSRVRHRVRDKALYGVKLGSTLRLPSWQFAAGRPIPGLRVVVAALPEGLHPLAVSNVMTIPDADLAVDGTPQSPRDWLLGGGDVTLIATRLQALDEW